MNNIARCRSCEEVIIEKAVYTYEDHNRVSILKTTNTTLFHKDHSSLISSTGLVLYFLSGSYANLFESGICLSSEKFVYL